MKCSMCPNCPFIVCSIYQSKKKKFHFSWPIIVPSACAQFPNEMIYYPEAFLRDKFYNLIQVTRMPRGGHFAALEEPKLLSDDVWKFVAAVRNDLKAANTKKDEF